MSLALHLLAHSILLGVTGYVILSANPGTSLFSWHPTLMILMWFMMTEGILLFRRPSHGWRVPLHWALMAGGLVAGINGFLSIYRNKENLGKSHFVTYHGLAGIFTLILLGVQAAGGNLANFSVSLQRKFPSLIKPKLIKWGHRNSGGVSLTALTLTVLLGLSSVWFTAVCEGLLWWVVTPSVLFPFLFTIKTAYL